VAAIDPVALRVFVYDELVDRGAPPSIGALGRRFGVAPNDARSALGELRIGKTILVHPQTGEIWMAGPFSAVETPYRVTLGDRQWWANCAWDMFGVAQIVGEPVRVDTRCTDCEEPLALVCDPAVPPNGDGVVHFLVPARRWYENIGFT
jgi:Alkylmercury lyase